MTSRHTSHRFVQLQTTLDSREQADELISGAVQARLAACGQLAGPIQSTYWWEGSMESAEEWLCLFKTRAELADALTEWVLERHPYEVPEIVVLPIIGLSAAYGEWIANETND